MLAGCSARRRHLSQGYYLVFLSTYLLVVSILAFLAAKIHWPTATSWSHANSLGLWVLRTDGRSITAPVQIPSPLAYIELTIRSVWRLSTYCHRRIPVICLTKCIQATSKTHLNGEYLDVQRTETRSASLQALQSRQEINRRLSMMRVSINQVVPLTLCHDLQLQALVMLPLRGNVYFILFRLHECTSSARKSRDIHRRTRSCRMWLFVALPVILKHGRPSCRVKCRAKYNTYVIHLLVATRIDHSCYSRYRWWETEALDAKQLGFRLAGGQSWIFCNVEIWHRMTTQI
jgi:hypothetical protein